jgi:hypothetical protein
MRQMDWIKWHLGFSNGFYIGHNWGLSMFWKTSCDLEIKSYSHNHFDAIVKEHLNAFCWLAWGFMANLTLILEEKLGVLWTHSTNNTWEHGCVWEIQPDLELFGKERFS